jgi:acyl-CoA dehydrogenase
MDPDLTEEQGLIRREIRALAEEFGDEYWREKDRNEQFPEEFHEAFADGGWYGLTIPPEYGGEGYGLREGVIVQEELARSGAGHAGVGLTGAQMFNAAPLIRYGSDAQKERYLPAIASGDSRLAVAITEPDAGLDTSRIETTAEREGGEYVVNGQKVWVGGAQQADLVLLLVRTSPRDKGRRFDGLTMLLTPFDAAAESVTVSEIEKAGRRAIDSNEVWFDDFRVPVEDRVGEADEGFTYLLDFANSERITVAAAANGIGKAAVDKAVAYANERVVFDNPIGSYQAVQHPLADSWSKLTLTAELTRKAATLYDADRDCGEEANAAKLRASEACVSACERAVRVHGGMGYAEEFDVCRYWRESIVTVISPVSNELVKNYIGHDVLGLPKSY